MDEVFSFLRSLEARTHALVYQNINSRKLLDFENIFKLKKISSF
jgi:hypothetical protein